MLSNEKKLDYSDVLIVPKRTNVFSRRSVTLETEFQFRHSNLEWFGVPIAAANMDGVGTFDMAKALSKHQMITFITKHHSYSDWKANFSSEMRDYCGVSTGISRVEIKSAIKILKDFNLKWFCIDVANGYSTKFIDEIRNARLALGPDAIIVAGNVVTPSMAVEVINSGADVVKVGIGPGSVCTTRIKSGVGYPQLSAVWECHQAVKQIGGHVMADGGCTCPGDVSKSFVAGASFSMLGGMLSGHNEGGGEVISKWYRTTEVEVEEDGSFSKNIFLEKKYVEFYGMSSDTAMKRHRGGVADYRASEGRTVLVPFKGSVNETVLDLLGGIRSSCTYVGASELHEIDKMGSFVLTNNQFNRSLI